MDYCKTCVYYPPSSCDGKPCTQCDITNPFLTCYREKEFIVDYFQQEHKQTNADRIRSMTDEELAEFISGKARTFGEEYEGYMSALDWLGEEAID